MDSLHFNWNRVNHSEMSDAASTRRMDFSNRRRDFEPLIADKNNILKCWDEESRQWIDFVNFPVFEPLRHSHPSLLSHAFFFHNLLARTFHSGAKNIAKIVYPQNWQSAVYGDGNGSNSEEWTLSFGFTHCRPI